MQGAVLGAASTLRMLIFLQGRSGLPRPIHAPGTRLIAGPTVSPRFAISERHLLTAALATINLSDCGIFASLSLVLSSNSREGRVSGLAVVYSST
jgi:hypothetical protein